MYLLLRLMIEQEYGKVWTRIGLSKEAEVFGEDKDLFDIVKNYSFTPDCILVDEAQFLCKNNVNELSNIVDELNIPVICYGLRADFKQNFFEGSKALMEIADKIEEIKTICECGAKATVNMRVINGNPTIEGEQILIGGNETYRSVCRRCYKNYIKDIH